MVRLASESISELWYNEPLYNEVLGITNYSLYTSKSNSIHELKTKSEWRSPETHPSLGSSYTSKSDKSMVIVGMDNLMVTNKSCK